MKKKYQIFVSSTYEDLKEERDLAIKAILEMGHIPVGMEMFSAADEKQWQQIARRIDTTDYYVVIVAHRYGSETDEGIGFTEKEYDYAVSKGIPALGFIIDNKAPWSQDRVDKDDKQGKLKKFKDKVRAKPVKFWRDKNELYGQVSLSLMNEIAENPMIGWVRTDDILKMKLIDPLEQELKEGGVIVHQDDDDWETWARTHILNKEIGSDSKKSYFIEYSGTRCQAIIQVALRKGWLVNLLIKEKDSEKNKFQKDRIITSEAFYATALNDKINKGKLNIKHTTTPPGLRVRYFEDKLLTLSWYIKTIPEFEGQNNIWSHENIHISFTPDSPDWEKAKSFWTEKLYPLFL